MQLLGMKWEFGPKEGCGSEDSATRLDFAGKGKIEEIRVWLSFESNHFLKIRTSSPVIFKDAFASSCFNTGVKFKLCDRILVKFPMLDYRYDPGISKGLKTKGCKTNC